MFNTSCWWLCTLVNYAMITTHLIYYSLISTLLGIKPRVSQMKIWGYLGAIVLFLNVHQPRPLVNFRPFPEITEGLEIGSSVVKASTPKSPEGRPDGNFLSSVNSVTSITRRPSAATLRPSPTSCRSSSSASPTTSWSAPNCPGECLQCLNQRTNS